MVPAGQEARVVEALAADIHARGDHVSAGDIGFHYVVRALAEHGRPELLHAMLSRTDAPSYGAQIAAGATALTENWDPSRGGSQNHFMLGHALGWLYTGLGGVKLDFWRTERPPITIAPQCVAGLGGVAVTYKSVLGPIRSAWTRDGAAPRFEIDIPAGSTATLELPGGKPQIVGSGRYRF
jgi:alpha-L-rhamnosidase